MKTFSQKCLVASFLLAQIWLSGVSQSQFNLQDSDFEQQDQEFILESNPKESIIQETNEPSHGNYHLGNHVALSSIAAANAPSYHDVYDTKKYLSEDQLFYEVEVASDHDFLGIIFIALEAMANQALIKNDHPNIFATKWVVYQPALKENGDPVVSFSRTTGFKLKDLIHYFRAGGKLGWTGGLNSCFGVYGEIFYEHRRQEIRLQHEDKHTYSWTNAIMPGIGIRFTPQFWTDEDQWNPYLEVGTTYTHIIGCKSRYGKDKEQFGHGLTYTFGIGARGNGLNRNTKFFLGFELPKYDFFNRTWSNDGGYYFPYANIRDRKWRITANVTLDLDLLFGDD